MLNFELPNLKYDELWPQTQGQRKKWGVFGGPQRNLHGGPGGPVGGIFFLHLTYFQLKIMLNNKGKQLTHIGSPRIFDICEGDLTIFFYG